MTTIAGYQGKGFAILGADSQITDGDKRIISPSTPKIVKVGK
jgi:ATP-dependent protease HslVU (ClpYQ) peptidase subunit